MAKFNIKKLIIFICLCLIFLVCAINFPYLVLHTLDDASIVTNAELSKLMKSNFFVTTELSSVNANDGDDTFNEYVIKYKLFNLFNITNLRVNVVADDQVYAGGNCLGFVLKSRGAVVVGGNFVLTEAGAVNPFADSGLKVGDVITYIDNNAINSISDISLYLKNFDGGAVNLTIERNGTVTDVKVTPALDTQTNTYKLGLWLKDDASGVGTLTFVNDTTGRYGSLGHAITNNANQVFDVADGNIYEANVIGVRKGERGRPGELLGLFNQTNPQGSIDSNNNYGVYGNVSEDNNLTNNKRTIQLGGRLTAKPGKAHILTTIDGYNIEKFDIEIIKTNFQNSAEEKSMVLRVTDPRLIEKTGGIVQGMSGSPIIQDGKLIGAVTHVFVNDPTKGFGLYIDWMINQ